jgi:hypothetical protein
MTKFALEKYRAFPYIAWGIVFGFSLFVFHLTQTLAEATQDLRDSRNLLEAQVQTPIEHLDFTKVPTTTRAHK